MTLFCNRFYARRHLLGSTVLVGAMAAAIMPIGAVAQDAASDATTLEPIILRGSGTQTISEDNDTIVPERSVSALKTDTPLVETPRSVSVITRKEMEQRAVTDIIQATRYSSGVSTGGFGYDPRFDQIYIRGVETTTSGDFRDGLRQPVMTYGTFTTEIYTLDRVEVLKGPVSVMYGAASAAGIVNKISKLPLQEAHHEVELQYGTVGRKQAAFDVGGPIGEGSDMFYRVVGLVREGETNYDIQDDRYLLQPSFTWEPTDSTKITIYGLAQDTETAASAWTFKNDGQIYLVSDPDYDYQKIRQYQLGYKLEHDFGNGLTFRQNARVSDLDLKARYLNRMTMFSAPADPWSTAAVTDKMRAYQIDNQLQAKFETGSISHTILAGLDYTAVNSDFAVGYGSTSPGNVGGAPTPALTGFTGNNLRQTGLYAQEQAEIGNWRFVGGLRYDWLDQTTTDKVGGTSDEREDGALSGQVGLLYLFDNGIAPYVSYGTSFVPSTELSASGAVLEPTVGRQIEAGIKYQPDGENFSLSSAVYRLVETGKPQYDPALPGGLYYQNSGENTFTGFEIEGRKAFDNGISLIAAYTYAHGEITGHLDRSIVGNTPTTTPRHVASLWVNYDAPEDVAIGGLSIGGGVRATSKSFTDNYNTARNAGVVYFDASIAYDFGVKSPDLKGLSLSVSATNLANLEEQVCNDGYCYFGQGRTVLGSLKYKW
ncbi:Ferrichrome-iron receptor [Neorhizobium galegae bv. orientalis]|uniref:TonB-dependent outermembrane ferrichrome receptor FhuA n=2 Tax=Neorhizobium galegae TaxID=399 RepID=A0A068T295_NEOGA|nr:TonB-dependent outermembrane ferrichrome receptor FhuA [Neorhizobium galegae bv. orientalis str. HAMBI 540]CDZ55131.1 Ferrichrome-iron receptor [Neorhizobium galegae bv. orientalis]